MARQIYNDTWASGGDKVDPGAVKTTSGWIVEAPPHEFFNFWQGQTDEMLQHLERNGISEFNAATIYDLGGYAREGAKTFRSLIVTNTGNLPSTSPTEWVQAFFQVAEAAGLDVANVFTKDQTIKNVASNTILNLDSDTGFDTRLNFKENAVLRSRVEYDESVDMLRIKKFDTNGTTVKGQLDFQNNGDINVGIGILKVAGNLVMHLGNDGAGSGFDADTVDGIEAAAIAQLSVANVFTQIQTIKSAGANSALLIDTDLGFDSLLIFKENGVNRAQLQYDESLDRLKLEKFDTNGTTVKARLLLDNNGDVDVQVGTLKVAGNLVFHAGNDGAGSGLDADLLDGIEGANYARTDIAETFTNNITLDSGSSDTPNFIMQDSVNNSKASMDVAGEVFRILTIFQGAAEQVPFTISLNTKIANFTNIPTRAGNNIIDTTNVASETVAGIVERATDAEASAGTDITRYVTPKQLIDNAGASTFLSGELTIGNGTLVTVTHGLGTRPTEIYMFIRCIIAEDNWIVGDELAITSGYVGSAGTGRQIGLFTDNTTQVKCRFTANTIFANMLDKTTGAGATLTNANWKLVIGARL